MGKKEFLTPKAIANRIKAAEAPKSNLKMSPSLKRMRRRRKSVIALVVKVMSKALADKGYYKQKGVVRRVIDKYAGEIEMLRVDQEELETVIPQIGGLVRIVNGAY